MHAYVGMPCTYVCGLYARIAVVHIVDVRTYILTYLHFTIGRPKLARLLGREAPPVLASAKAETVLGLRSSYSPPIGLALRM